MERTQRTVSSEIENNGYDDAAKEDFRTKLAAEMDGATCPTAPSSVACGSFLGVVMSVPVDCIRLLSVKAGSVIIRLELVGQPEKPAVSLYMQVQAKQSWHVCGREVDKPKVDTDPSCPTLTLTLDAPVP